MIENYSKSTNLVYNFQILPKIAFLRCLWTSVTVDSLFQPYGVGFSDFQLCDFCEIIIWKMYFSNVRETHYKISWDQL